MRASRGQSSTSGSTLPTPLDSSESPEYVPEDDDEFEDSAFSGSPLSAPEDYESDEAEESEEDMKPAKKKQKKVRGRRLDDRKADELPPTWQHRSKAEREAELERIKEEKKLIKKEEANLSKKLGRKLTQGERNQIRLGMVSSLTSITQLNPAPPRARRRLGRPRGKHRARQARPHGSAPVAQAHPPPLPEGEPVLDEEAGGGRLAWWHAR